MGASHFMEVFVKLTFSFIDTIVERFYVCVYLVLSIVLAEVSMQCPFYSSTIIVKFHF